MKGLYKLPCVLNCPQVMLLYSQDRGSPKAPTLPGLPSLCAHLCKGDMRDEEVWPKQNQRRLENGLSMGQTINCDIKQVSILKNRKHTKSTL